MGLVRRARRAVPLGGRGAVLLQGELFESVRIRGAVFMMHNVCREKQGRGVERAASPECVLATHASRELYTGGDLLLIRFRGSMVTRGLRAAGKPAQG